MHMEVTAISFLNDYLIVVLRVVTLLPLFLAVALFMGRRAMGEVPIFDFLVIITLASVVGADIGNPDISHGPTVVAIILIALLQKIVSHVKLSHRKINKFINFTPTTVIYEGMILHQPLKKIGFSIDNLLQMLRDKGIFDIQEVHIAIIEGNGALSVLKKPEKQLVTLDKLQIPPSPPPLTFPVILEGAIHTKGLEARNLNQQWLTAELAKHGITDSREVFFASVNMANELYVSLYQTVPPDTPPLNG
ncbi:DUF421 domain-containing protein [Gracilibacillus alcaliphilus]|uniref:DUF421 domain-containing protein n=1 Tax=Gracilibacillus alcaliphilus TaxID=1401441 RepID=UPI001EF902F2|nr:DUF421 domain-containing protein [Gracilibacillus alcaliphilus]MBM7677004.1 uncharacterized membrane protein YcaP (DUF421 family) [Gracilibacillus alcaliphilus]